MTQELGESREAWAWDVWRKAEEYASNLKSDKEPFYLVFAAKQDRSRENTFRQSFRFYRQRPPQILGLLVWYVDHSRGIFELVPELSVPPDVPLDPTLLSTKSCDEMPSVMKTGREMGVLLA